METMINLVIFLVCEGSLKKPPKKYKFKYSLKPLREEHWPWMLNLIIALKISKKK